MNALINRIFGDSPTLGSCLGGRDNNLNLIRMAAAVSVLISHAYPLTLGTNGTEPFERLLGYSLGSIAVDVFFVISGLLITRSFERRTFNEFASARLLRLFPGLAVVLLLTIIVLGPFATSLPVWKYFSDPHTLTYFPANISLMRLQYDLPGVFLKQPYPAAINGSLWSLFPEVACYMGTAIVGLTGLLASRRRFVGAICLYLTLYVLVWAFPAAFLNSVRIQTLVGMSFPFFVGITFYKFRDGIPLNVFVAGFCVIIILFGQQLSLPSEIYRILIAYAVMFAAYIPAGFIRRYNQFGDYSYGFYIYAFAMQQTVVYWLGPMEPITNMAIAGSFTLILAIASWHWVESPALAVRRQFAVLLCRLTPYLGKRSSPK